ncbi:MAG: twin-arginine translocase subunit TatC, partial [bacterium]
LDLLIADLPVESLYFMSPIEAFMVRVKISFVLGLLAAFPFVLFKIWAFVSPGLFSHERKRIYPLVISSSALFYIGVTFCYVILIPTVMRFLLGFGTEFVNPLISVVSYFAFVARLCFAFGIVFQIPIVVMLLTMLGIVTPGWLLRQWRYGVVIVFVACPLYCECFVGVRGRSQEKIRRRGCRQTVIGL